MGGFMNEGSPNNVHSIQGCSLKLTIQRSRGTIEESPKATSSHPPQAPFKGCILLDPSTLKQPIVRAHDPGEMPSVAGIWDGNSM